MIWHTVFMSIMVLFTRDVNSIEKVEVFGKVTCHGQPVEGVQIIMIDDNIWVLDHILNVRRTNVNGKFRLVGAPNDKDLDLLLVIEHDCHNNRNHRSGKKIESHSNYRIPLHTLEEAKYRLEVNIELDKHAVHNSWPALYAWRTAADIKTGFSENANKLHEQLNKEKS